MSQFSPNKTLVGAPSDRPQGLGNPCLVVIKGDELGRRINLGQEDVEIGRNADCALAIESDLVSRRHAVVHSVNGTYVVADLESTNGTFVNGQKVKAKTLVDGDKISVGKTVLKYMENSLELHYHEELLNLVTLDPLTGVYNKRFFDDSLGREANKAVQTGEPLCLVLYDVDFFKKVNDTHGHLAGDQVLRRVTATVKTFVADDQVLARIGGEEFALLLPCFELPSAHERASQIRQAVASTPLPTDAGNLSVTISLGVDRYLPGEPVADFFRRADARLYEAKRNGRNCVR